MGVFKPFVYLPIAISHLQISTPPSPQLKFIAEDMLQLKFQFGSSSQKSNPALPLAGKSATQSPRFHH